MKKSWIVLMFGLAASGCIKNDIEKNCGEVKTKAPDAEVATLKAYLDSKGIAATQDPRGFFYKIEPEGSGTKPTVCSQITVDYVGKLTNDSTFDSQTDISFPLNGVITGWQEGLPLVAPGGTIYLYIPPTLGYGAANNGKIPANSNLIFKVDLKSVN